MATNHLGHFALTGLLLDRIVTTERSRIVTVSSHMHRMGRLRPDDVAGAAFHSTWVAYGTSKLANLLFTDELSRRLEAAGLPTLALAAHPGWTRSNLAGSGAALGTSRLRRKLARAAGTTLGQSAAGGAQPILCAATSLIGPLGPVHRPGISGRVVRPAPGGAPLPACPRPAGGRRPLGGIRGTDRRAFLGGRSRLSTGLRRRGGAGSRRGAPRGRDAERVRAARSAWCRPRPIGAPRPRSATARR